MGLYGNSPNLGWQMEEQQKQADLRQQQGLANINTAFAGFDEDFYNRRAQAYENYALPRLQQQYGLERNTIGFNLANRGITGGSAAKSMYTNLGQEMIRQQQGIVDTGQQYANQLRQQIATAKSNLISELGASTYPSATAQQALAAASQFNAPSPFAAATGSAFDAFNTGLLTQQALASAQNVPAYNLPSNLPQGFEGDSGSAPLPDSSYTVNA